MTEKKITYALNKIKAAKEKGYLMEALLRTYHLNADIIRYILDTCSEDYLTKDKKVKAIFNKFLEEISVNQKLKAILAKKNLKTLKPWLGKMDVFFKTLKMRQPANMKDLQQEAEKIMGMLNISVSKMFAHNKA